MDYQKIVLEIIDKVGGAGNIQAYTSCITRLRLSLRSKDLLNMGALSEIEGILGIKENGNEIQLVFGPGKVDKAWGAMDEYFQTNQLGNPNESVEDQDAKDFSETIQKEKAAVKAKRTTRFQGFMAKFSNIFVPLIPGFIAAGMLAGISGLCRQLGLSGPVLDFIAVFNRSLLKFMYIMVGYNAASAFGGSGVIGGILAGLFLLSYGEGGNSGMSEFFGITVDPRGGMIGVLFGAIIGAKIEQIIRKRFSWEPTDIITTPMLTLLITGSLTFVIIMPLSYRLFGIMNYFFEVLNGNPIGGGILAGLFLPSVMMGIHQGFVPVYQGLVESTGMNSLFPILAMAGAGQVGAALALYVKADKHSKLRKNIRGAIVPGFLGIGEPLIYGVTLPRVKPFFTSMAGGAVGGVYIGLLAQLGLPFGLNTVFGSSGILGAFAMTSPMGVIQGILLYLSALLVSYVAGFILTYFFGTKNVDLS